MRYTVDSIESQIVKLINVSDGEIKYENVINIPFEIEENDVLLFNNNTYQKDDIEKNDRIKTIEEKMAMLRSNE